MGIEQKKKTGSSHVKICNAKRENEVHTRSAKKTERATRKERVDRHSSVSRPLVSSCSSALPLFFEQTSSPRTASLSLSYTRAFVGRLTSSSSTTLSPFRTSEFKTKEVLESPSSPSLPSPPNPLLHQKKSRPLPHPRRENPPRSETQSTSKVRKGNRKLQPPPRLSPLLSLTRALAYLKTPSTRLPRVSSPLLGPPSAPS